MTAGGRIDIRLDTVTIDQSLIDHSHGLAHELSSAGSFALAVERQVARLLAESEPPVADAASPGHAGAVVARTAAAIVATIRERSS